VTANALISEKYEVDLTARPALGKHPDRTAAERWSRTGRPEEIGSILTVPENFVSADHICGVAPPKSQQILMFFAGSFASNTRLKNEAGVLGLASSEQRTTGAFHVA
jgi:hypothetical protein